MSCIKAGNEGLFINVMEINTKKEKKKPVNAFI